MSSAVSWPERAGTSGGRWPGLEEKLGAGGGSPECLDTG